MSKALKGGWDLLRERGDLAKGINMFEGLQRRLAELDWRMDMGHDEI